MAIGSADGGVIPIAHNWKRALLGFGASVAVLVVLFAIAALLLSGATLASDPTALAHVSVQPLGGSIEHIEAFGPHGRSIPLAIHDGRLTPLRRLTPGEQVSVDVQVRRPGWIGWALGKQHTVHLTLRTPLAQVTEPWMTVPNGSPVRVSFSEPVSAVSYYGGADGLTRRVFADAVQRTVSLGRQPATGATEIAAAPRPWESVGTPMQVSWFPPASSPVMATIPGAGDRVSPTAPVYLTFSKPVSEVLGEGQPQLSTNAPGHWHELNSHTVEFVPAGFGAPLGSQLRIQLPRTVAVTAGSSGLRDTRQVEWTVPQGSTLRLQQLLAETGYLPVDWHPASAPVPRTPSAQAQAAVDPPPGSFSWRYPNTPQQLKALWTPGQWSVVMKGAVMKFENENNLTVDGEAGPTVWRALLPYVLAGKRLHEPYSYVYVHREVPETMTLWSAGRTVESAPANTGISGAETALGTFPVFEHIPEGTMSGTNPDGSHYEDPGIKWISYFNGG
ncbi:MAG TPA: L,D-transpeptidase family protein, partial [Solirubrobacteraceae bacterium]|nr:L,D-transpeptidase family protein [Solirubrobacteraceae bacterium]